ncbi:RelE toxin of RelEB toxin-antitoxin system [Phyllobacterium leguminum]|uniref:RelE toxin of RelEB toxin-antitoxin system n=2 Tax=Phyllobacterium leguminum TaxID=314237 RepID=A0A318T5Q9_9HYPH|nr:RelE toxin of RelEB toxin-antitoxin system [Phyllobacterium leguminum]
MFPIIDKCAEIQYQIPMHTVIETPAYLASAKDENVTEDERNEIVSFLASNPDAGDVMAGTGGARKMRFGGRGKGKSGGYRIITFYADKDIPVFLLDIYSKDTQENLSKAERNELRKILTALPQAWRESISEQVKKLRSRK